MDEQEAKRTLGEMRSNLRRGRLVLAGALVVAAGSYAWLVALCLTQCSLGVEAMLVAYPVAAIAAWLLWRGRGRAN